MVPNDMKQHISPEQVKQISEEQFYLLFAEIVKRDDYATFHHKKMTIGKMMEFLRQNFQVRVYSDSTAWNIRLFDLMDYDHNPENVLWGEWKAELCDVLWEAVVYCIRKFY